MGKLKEMLWSKATETDSSWTEENNYALAHVEEIRANTKIILRIRQYMEDHGMRQNELAEKLSVTPQYINKLLHGADPDLKVSTAVRYSNILGINLIEIPEPEANAKPELIVKIIKVEECRPNPEKEISGTPAENGNSIYYYNTLTTKTAQALKWSYGRKTKHDKRLS